MGLYFSEIKEQHIYYVDFDPVKTCEFNGKHLVIVLKKNLDKKTAIVLPLTSSSSGANKINLGKIKELPSNLNIKDTYLVLDQIRTVNFDRFSKLKENNNFINVELKNTLFLEVVQSVLSNTLEALSLDDRIVLYDSCLKNVKLEKLINLCYSWKKATTDKEKYENEIKELIDFSVEYDKILSPVDLKNDIGNIIKNLKK